MKAEHFAIQELVPPKVYEARGELAWELIDDREIITLDAMRKRYGTIFVNTWHFATQPLGQVFQWSGLRTWEYYSSIEAFEKSFSQHKYGRATDKKFMDVTAEEVRQDILKNYDLFPYVNSIELGTSWLHSDCRNCERIKAYKP